MCPQALPQTCEFDPTRVLKAMFPLITRHHVGWPLHSHTQLVVPGASFTCQAENLSEIESENNARKLLKSCTTGDYMFSPFCRISDSKIDCVSVNYHTLVQL